MGEEIVGVIALPWVTGVGWRSGSVGLTCFAKG